jgi:hypothetical protein
MLVSTIIVPHLEHDGQFDTSVARAVGWVLVMEPSLVGGSTTELSATDARLLVSWPVTFVRRHESRNSELFFAFRDRIVSPSCLRFTVWSGTKSSTSEL